MYEREKLLSLPVTASAQPCNLSRLSTGDQVYMTVIHKQEVNIACVTNPAPQPIRVFPQIGSHPFTVTQASWIKTLSGQHLLVLTGYGGVLIYDWDGAVLLRVVNLQAASTGQEEVPKTLFTRGIASLEGNIVVGCSTGEVIVLGSGDGNCSSYDYRHALGDDDTDYDQYAEPDYTVGTELARFKWRPHAVSALAVEGGTVVVGDNRGHIMVGENDGTGIFEIKWQVDSYGSAVSCLASQDGCLVAGYISGHIRIFDLAAGRIKAEVCGHGRAVTGLDMVSGAGDDEVRVVTAGEDTFTRVWLVQAKGDKVELVHSHREPDQLSTGVAFTDEKGNGYVTTAYDVAGILFFITT